VEEKTINKKRHVKIQCAYTKEWFWKYKSEYIRKKRSNPNCPFYKDLKAKAAAYQDKYTPFRYFMMRACKKRVSTGSRRKEFKDFDVTLEYLYELWGEQGGICPYSGLKMTLPQTRDMLRDSPFCASLDRTDPKKGYVIGNVKFVTQFVNLGKNKYSEKQIKEFFEQ